MIEELHSLDDERLDVFLRLTEVQLRNRLEPEKGIFVAESENVILRALDAGYEPVSALVPHKKLQTHQVLLERLAAFPAASATASPTVNTTALPLPHHTAGNNSCPTPCSPTGSIPIFTAPDELIEQLTGYELTRGMLAAFRRKPLPSVEALLEGAHCIALLENITNHTNIGALFRSAAALGVDAVVLNQGCCDPLYRRAVRVSMGTVFQIPWTRVGMDFDFEQLRAQGFTSCAFALTDESLPLGHEELDRIQKAALVFGTEGTGLRESTIHACDCTVRIPMRHGVDSLNVAAASAVAFWHFCGLR